MLIDFEILSFNLIGKGERGLGGGAGAGGGRDAAGDFCSASPPMTCSSPDCILCISETGWRKTGYGHTTSGFRHSPAAAAQRCQRIITDNTLTL